MSLVSGEPIRIAIIGSGPAGFYLADALLKHAEAEIHVDLFERLFAPYGLVRYGVAPDHQKIKSVTRVFDKIAQHPRFRFFGNVSVGTDVSLAELLERYHQVAFCTGCEDARDLGIEGERGHGSHSATQFVAWYNGHPELRPYEVSLATRAAAVVGIGDVSMDLTRMLLKPISALNQTDCVEYALEVFRESQVQSVHILARRGPAEARFADKELRDISELEGVAIHVDKALVAQALAEPDHPNDVKRKLEFLRSLAEHAEEHGRSATKHVHLHFLCSPKRIQLVDGRVAGLVVERNRLVPDGKGGLMAQGTGSEETLDVGLVFRAVGYRGRPLAGVPFDERSGIIPNVDGRVTRERGGEVLPRVYAAGWIKRGPSGVIGTNKGDAGDTAQRMLGDLAEARPGLAAGAGTIDALLAERGVRAVTFIDWQKLDKLESEQGKQRARPRAKFVSVEECWSALDAAAP